MRTRRDNATLNRRGFVGKAAGLTGAVVFAPSLVVEAAPADRAPPVRLAQSQTGGGATAAAPALQVKSVAHLAGSTTGYAYATKAGPWIFLNGHEAFDFETGLAPEVEGPRGYALSGRPPLRREADYILRRMRGILKDFGSDLPNAVRVDQYYTKGPAVSAYHLARFAEFEGYIPPSTSIIMERCFCARTNTHTSMIAIVPGPDWSIQKVTLPGQPISASGYSPAVVVNDFVFVAGNMALQQNGTLGQGVEVRPTARWGGQTAFRRQVHYVIKQALEPSLQAAGSSLEQSVKAQAYIRGVENFPDFMDVWLQYFREIPCAITLVPAKDYASSEGMIEINLIALRNGATRRKQVVQTDLPPLATWGPCVRAGELVFASGLMGIGRDGSIPAVANGAAFDGLSLAGQTQGSLVLSYAESICKAVGVSMRNVLRAQYFMTDVREFAGVSAAWADRYGNQPHPLAVVQVPGPLPAEGAGLISDFWIYAPS
jgi:enamine deaminase RidA (YjgF/YER057c/UK114 family)